MLDQIAIQQLLNKYTDGCSRADWDQVMATFLPDGIWEVPVLDARFEGHAAIRAAMAGFAGQMAYFVQLNSPATITVEGDKATATSVVRECGKYADRDLAMEVLGTYDDELVRTADGWKFVRRIFRSLGVHHFALQPVAWP
jgi:ketosteroid isomerase-like protein